MKNHRLIAFLLVLCILSSLTACMPSNLNQTEPENPTTTVPTTTVPPTTTAPKPTELNLLDYDTGIDASVINIDSFVQLYQHAEYILQTYKTFTYSRSYKFYDALFEYERYLSESSVWTSDSVIVYIDKLSENDRLIARFLIVLFLLTKEYEDSCCYRFYNWYEAKPEIYNDRPSPEIVVATGYDDNQFATIKEYSDAIFQDLTLGDLGIISDADEAFVIIQFSEGRIIPIQEYKEYGYNSKQYLDKKNLVDAIVAKAFPEE